MSRPSAEAAPASPRPRSFQTDGVEETEALGRALGERAFPGAVLLLEGPLGAGKTALARGVARGLQVAGRVSSPSFTILAVHPGPIPFFHLDLYRVESPDELRALDLDEVFGAGGVAAVEWPRWLLERPPEGALEVAFKVLAPATRLVDLRAFDRRWEPALDALGPARRAGRRVPAAEGAGAAPRAPRA